MSGLLRPFNFVGGIGTLIVAVFVLLFVGITFRSLLCLYFTGLVGILMLAREFNLTIINQNCKFLVTFLGRGFFDLFVGGWVYSLHINYFCLHWCSRWNCRSNQLSSLSGNLTIQLSIDCDHILKNFRCSGWAVISSFSCISLANISTILKNKFENSQALLSQWW